MIAADCLKGHYTVACADPAAFRFALTTTRGLRLTIWPFCFAQARLWSCAKPKSSLDPTMSSVDCCVRWAFAVGFRQAIFHFDSTHVLWQGIAPLEVGFWMAHMRMNENPTGGHSKLHARARLATLQYLLEQRVRSWGLFSPTELKPGDWKGQRATLASFFLCFFACFDAKLRAIY